MAVAWVGVRGIARPWPFYLCKDNDVARFQLKPVIGIERAWCSLLFLVDNACHHDGHIRQGCSGFGGVAVPGSSSVAEFAPLGKQHWESPQV